MIATKGYTQTSLIINGNTTDIITKTIVGKNAFNSFSKFDVYQGKTVNLHVPSSAQNLLNIVHDKKSQIDGTLNAYKNGQIGGNVYFANPNGMVISKSGTVNVGRLTITTPTKKFVDGFFDGVGKPSAMATQQLLNGTAPLNGKAKVDIQGQINSKGSTAIRSGYIDIAGEINTIPTEKIVNLTGQNASIDIKQENGEIILFAKNDIDITGGLHADGKAGVNAGNIDIHAERNITLTGQAQLTAQGAGNNSNGGRVTVLGDNKATIRDNATLNASSTGTGDAGFVEFSAKNTVDLAGGNLLATAENGQKGTVLIDPENLIISTDLLRNQAQGIGDGINWNAGSLQLLADKKITVKTNVVISTRAVNAAANQSARDAHINNQSTGDSGNLLLDAPSIDIQNGAQLLTFADNNFRSGNIDLLAMDNALLGIAEINIGNNVQLKSYASGNSSSGDINLDVQGIANFVNVFVPVYNKKNTQATITIGSAQFDANNITVSALSNSQYALSDGAHAANLQEGTIDFLGSITPVAGVATSNADANITVTDAAINARGKVSIQSTALAEAKAITPSMLIGVVYGRTDVNAKADIAGSTTITAGDNIDIGSKTNSDLAVSAIVVTTAKSKSADVAIAYSTSDINTDTSIGTATKITSQKSVNVTAEMNRKSSTKSTAMALEGGLAGLALSVSNSNVTTKSDVKGDIQAGGDINITSHSNTDRNETESSVTVGTSPLIGTVIYKATNALRDKAGIFSSTTSPAALAAGVAVATHTNTTQALVSSAAKLKATGTLAGKGNIAVDAEIKDKVQSSANASIESTDRNEKKRSLSGAVNVATFSNTALAKVSNASLDAAKNINVNALIVKPYEVTWHQINGVGDIVDKLNPNLGIQNGFFTSWAGNKSGGSGATAGAAVNITNYNFDSQAIIDNNAQINKDNGITGSNRHVGVTARNLIETVNLSGTFAKAGDSVNDGKFAGGGAYLEVNYGLDTKALIGNGVAVNADALKVLANATSRNVSIAGAGSSGANTAVSGSTSNLNVTDNTISNIANDAVINLTNSSLSVQGYDAGKAGGFDPADIHYLDSTGDGQVDTNDKHVNTANNLDYGTDLSLLLAAEDEADLYNITGGVTAGKNVGIGVSVSKNTIDRNTRASIGDLADLSSYTGSVSLTGKSLLAAQNVGDIYAFSLAGAGSTGSAGSPTSTGSGKYGLAVSGDTSINTVNDTTQAYLNNGTITNTSDVELNAGSATNITAASGSAAIAVGSKQSAGIAGSYSQNTLTGSTQSFAKGVTWHNIGSLSSIAKTSGDILSISAGGSGAGPLGVAGSVSLNKIDYTTEAFGDDNNDFNLTSLDFSAENSGNIIAVGGIVAYGGKAGIGGGYTENTITNKTHAYLAHNHINISGDVSLNSKNSNTIKSYASTLGASQTASLAVSIASNIIGNESFSYMDNSAFSTSQPTVTAHNISINALENSDIEAVTGSISASGKGAVGAALSINKIANISKAYMRNMVYQQATHNIDINAINTNSILAVTYSVGASTSLLGGGGAIAVNRISNDTEGYVNGQYTDVQANDILINADSQEAIKNIAVAAAGANGLGVGGSISTNFIGNTTNSYINEGAQIKAEDDLAVLANNDDKLSVASGSAGIGIEGAGIGLSILTNEISGDTNAYISGIGTKVSALGKNTSDNLSVNNGQLASTVNLGQQVDLASYSTLDLKNNKQNKTVNGLAVNAGSTQQIEAIAVNVGAGSLGVGLIENINLIAGNTRAYLENASINESLSGAGVTQQVDVTASNHSYINDFAGNVTGGAAGGIGFGEDLTTIARGVYAYGRNSTINSRGALNINALAAQGISSLAIGGAGGGTVGFAGTGVLAQFKGETKSYLDTVIVDAGSVNVIADSQEDLFLVSGAAAVAGEGAAGGSFAVGINDSTTQAYIKGNTTRSKVTAQNDVNVKASSSTHINNYSIAGAGAGGVGVAGSVAVNIVKNTVEADIDKTDIGTSISKVASIDVATNNDVNIKTRAGAGGLGSLLGIGAGAVVNILKSRSVANVTDSKLYTSGLLNIAADSQNDIDSLAVMVGAGGTVGIGGAVAVNMVGDNLSTESGDELDKDNKGTLTKVNDFTNKDRFEKLQGSDNDVLAADEKSRLNSGAQGDVKDIANGNDATHLTYQTAANVSTNSIIDAGSLTITAKDLSKIKSIVGTGGIGAIGVGGAVAVSSYKANVNAIVDSTSQVTTSGNIMISAQVDNDGHDTLDQETWAGAAGAIGLGAAVTHATISNNVNAGVAGLTQVGTGSLNVIAADKSTINSKAWGAQVGALTAGAVVSRAIKQSDVNASLANNLSITSGNSTITADNTGKVYAEAEAAAGGLQGSGIGADARSEDKSTVSAETAANSTVNLQHGGLSIVANASPEVEAKAEGINVSLGVRVGVSNAFAKATTTVDAHLADNNTITASDLSVISKVTQNTSADSAKARAFAAGGGLLIGVGATYSDASSNLTSNSFVGDNSSLTVTGQMNINSIINSKQYADADGYNGGLLALGFNESHATSNTKTQAILGENITVTGGNLTVASTGEDNNFAQAISGSGGLIGGSSAKAFTKNSNETQAYINSGVINVDQFVLKGEHTATFNSAVDSSFGSVFGGSGAYVNNSQASDVLVAFRKNVAVTAKNIDVNAINKVRKNWLGGGKYNVLSGSGGVVDAPAGTSHTDLNLTTLITVADNDSLNVVGNRLHPGELAISALNDVLAKDKVKLDSGGVLPIALVESKITNDINDANVKVANAELRSVGDIILSARNKTDIKSQANAKTYGLAGAGLGTTLSRVVAHNGVLIKSGAYLRADGNMKILAGQDKTGVSNDFKVIARTDLWNKTAIPFWTDPKADAKLTQTNTIEIQNGAELGSVKNSYLLADEGSVLVEGKGIGKDAYRTALAAVANAFRRLAGKDEISFDIHGGSSSTTSQSKVSNNGIVKAGIQNKQYLTIKKDGTVDLNDPQGKSDGVNFTRTKEDLSNNIDAQIAQYEQLKLDFSDLPDVVAAYQAEIDRLNAQKSQLKGLNTNVGFITVDGIFAQSSNIFIQADNLSGTGKLEAPGDTLIQIKNHSANFLRTDWLMIPENSGGRITFNNIQVHNSAEINARNQGATASFNSVITSENSAAPLIHVENTYRPGSGGNPAGIEPDIEITGDITNLRGTVEVINEAGSVNVGGNIIANTIDIQAGKDLVLSYVNGFRHLGGDPKAHWATVANYDEAHKVDRVVSGIRSGGSTLIAGNNIFASAKILNINGLIQSGLPDNFITIDNAPQIYEDYQSSTAGLNSLAWARSDYSTKIASNPSVSEYYRLKEGSGDTIDAFYNAKLDRIELQDVKVQGGYMQLFGQIISTGAGELKVLDGFGRIDIANNSAKSLVLAQLDVGTQREGQIKITDTNFRGVNNQPLTTWYRRLGDQISVWDSATVDANGNPNNLVRYETAGQKSTTYSPKTGQYFSWLKREKKTITKKKTEYKLTCFYVTDCSNDSSTSNGSTTHSAPTFVRDDLVLNYQNKNDDYWYDNTYLVNNTGWYRDNSKGGGDGYTKEVTSTDFGLGTVEWYKKEWWYYKKDIYETWYHQHNVKAFHDIAINFIGYDTAKLNVASTGNILINGGLNNSTGPTILSTLGSIEQLTPNASIGGQDINLVAVTGIGNNSTIKTNLNGGQLSALTQTGNITLSETLGDLNYSKLNTNNGDISITVDGDLTRANGLALIKANKIDLTSTYGDIGSASNRVIIDSGSNMANGDGLNANAAKDIYLTEQSGDLLVNSVNAKGGNADIMVSTGSLIDANPNETRDTRTEAELLSLWNDMQLVGTVGTDEASYASKTIQGFENTKTSNYRRYWQYRSRQADPTVYDANFAIVSTADEINTFKQQGWTDQQISAFDQQRSQQYHAFNSEFAAVGDSFDKNYQYHATADDIADLSQGSVWTTNQLKFAIGGGLLKETSDTNARIEDPNLLGINVKLNVANKVGRTLNDIVIDNTPATLNLTDQERIALASAEAGDITINNSEIRIKQRDNVNIDARDSLRVDAGQDIYIGSEKDINVDHIRSASQGNIIIKSGQGIYNVAGNAMTNIDGGAIILEAARGSLGSASAPILYSSANNITARTGQDMYLKSSGDMLISTLYARKHIQLDANNIIDALNTDNTNIRSHSLDLTATNAVGSDTNALDIALDSDGLLTAITTAGSVNIATPDRGLTIGNIQSAGDITLKVKGDVLNGQTDDNVLLTGNNFTLTSTSGQVGSASRSIIGDANDVVNINAETGIFYEERNGDLSSNRMTSNTGPVDINVASGNGQFDTISTLGAVNIGISGGTLNIDTVNAGSAIFKVAEESGVLDIRDLQVKDRLEVAADVIHLPLVMHTGTVNKLRLNLSGNDAGIADEININVNSSIGTFYEKLSIKDLKLSSSSGNIDLSNFTVDGFAEIKLPNYSVVIYNGIPRLFPDADIQLAGGSPINLIIRAGSKLISTNAMVVDYKPNYIINRFSSENSLARLGEKRSAQQIHAGTNFLIDTLYPLFGGDKPLKTWLNDRHEDVLVYDPKLLAAATASLPTSVTIQ